MYEDVLITAAAILCIGRCRLSPGNSVASLCLSYVQCSKDVTHAAFDKKQWQH